MEQTTLRSKSETSQLAKSSKPFLESDGKGPTTQEAPPKSHLLRNGIAATLIYIIFVLCLIFFGPIKSEPLSLNELGDSLAGLFAPLAFFWLVLGYFQQGTELRLNSEALRLQVEELRQTAEHAGAMVHHANEAARKQKIHETITERSLAQPSIKLSFYIADSESFFDDMPTGGKIYFTNSGDDAYINGMEILEAYEGIAPKIEIREWYIGPMPNGHTACFVVRHEASEQLKARLKIRYTDKYDVQRSVAISFSIFQDQIETSLTTRPLFDEVEGLYKKIPSK